MSSEHAATPFGQILPPREDWLAGGAEAEILEPGLEIVDTHHHFWDKPTHRYLLDDWLADMRSGHNVVATVFIECQSMYRADGPPELRPVGEVEFVAGIAAMAASGQYGPGRVAAGIVGFADLTLAERVEPVLEALIRAGGGRFRGVRHAAGWDASAEVGQAHHAPGPGLYLRDDFRAGLSRLAALGLSLDALVYHPQLPEVAGLARACPEATIVLNHTGLPLGYGPYRGRREAVYAAWKAGMTEVAGCPNVVLKLGGMMMRLGLVDYMARPAPPSSAELADLWRPYVEPCIELFGAARCSFESNFPVDKMGIGYAGLWNAFKRLAAGASAAEKRALFAGTARRVYRLE